MHGIKLDLKNARFDRDVRAEQVTIEVPYAGVVAEGLRRACVTALQDRMIGPITHRDVRAVTMTIQPDCAIIVVIGSASAVAAWTDERLLDAIAAALASAYDDLDEIAARH